MKELAEKIRAEIEARGVISFATFMRMVLYCPVYGYYEREKDTIGTTGDFYTSASTGPLFGQLLAFQFSEWFENLDTSASEPSPDSAAIDLPGFPDDPSSSSPSPPLEERRPFAIPTLNSTAAAPETGGKRNHSLQIVEAGAHKGQLAADILGWMRKFRPTLFERLEYKIIEPSARRQS